MKVLLSVLGASIWLMGCQMPEKEAQAVLDRERREDMEFQKRLEEARENF